MLNAKLLLLIITLNIQARISTCDVHMFVSPAGSDKNDGLSDRIPLKSIHQALTNAKQTKYKNETLYIELMPGYHDLQKTLVISRSNTILRSYKQLEVHVTGGRQIPVTSIKHVTDKAILSRLPASARQHVRVVNLRDLNITNFGKMDKYGSNARRSSPFEVFFNGQPLHLARWPNDGYLDIVELPDGKSGMRFRYNSTVPHSWQNESDPWTYGYWYAGWTDGAVKVKSMNVNTKIITLAEKPPHGFRSLGHWQAYQEGKSLQDGGYFRFINILSELDQPGEYYLDRDSAKLYMWVPNHDGSVKSSDRIYISMINDCIDIYHSATNVHLEDFTIEACRRAAVFARGVQKVKLYKMEIRNTGHIALRFAWNSMKCEILQCYIHDTCGGINMNGGNRHDLESSGNIIENNEIVRTARVGTAGNDAIIISGDGHIVRNNHIYDSQAGAINFAGNDFIFEYNLIHDVCKSLTSCNAIRTGYDWTYRGNIIRYNTIHHSLRQAPGGSNKAIYIDAQGSGTSIMYNIFYDNDVHVHIGGGRYNEIINNVMYNATYSSIGVDSRGTNHRGDSGLYNHLHVRMSFITGDWTLFGPILLLK
ncbi:uncharacterized protein LOC128547518 [Mercenaria mercenaria]|uniref:uncharacterized protein LOC128547518 n=1 Tax=Mercenaria mercenaria TaxID=6596 RepID=UPI00234F2320|nr:uncharacterized protein LOC128547518 [Mercenaria mercenaria]